MEGDKSLTIHEVLNWASDICNKAESLSDGELKNELTNIHDYIMGENPEGDLYFVTHDRFWGLYIKYFGSIIDEKTGNLILKNNG